jgi:hypothetical protein
VDQFQFEVDVVEDGDLVLFGASLDLVVDVQVLAFVVFEGLLFHVQVLEAEFGEAGQDVLQTHQLPEGLDEFQFFFFTG